MPATDTKEQNKSVNGGQKTTGPKTSVSRTWERLKGLPSFWMGAGAVASSLAAILGVAAWLFPSLQPQPPSAETWADLSNLAEGPHLTLDEYLQRPGVSATAKQDAENSLGGADRGRVGSVVFFDVEVKGYRGEPTHIVWSLYEEGTRKPVVGLTNQKAWPYSLIEPRSETRKLALETWVALPQERKGPFVLSLEMFGGEGEGRLDYEELTIHGQDAETPAKATTNSEA
jgi:hypothetical protein